MKSDLKNDCLRKLPSVDELLKRPDLQHLILEFSRSIVVQAVQLLLEERRKNILALIDTSRPEILTTHDITLSEIENKVTELIQPSLKRVINATGIIVHTNLGRTPLSEEAIRHVVEVARHYSNLEFELEDSGRGFRSTHIESLLQKITGAEAGFVVNNNAAAVLASLNTLSRGKEVIISRGELIEIGGSFRIPEIMQQSGATLVEVGSTNRTHLADYEAAINERTALLLSAHTSNYRIIGFTAEVNLSELISLGRKHGIPVMYDMGSGNFVAPSLLGLRDEPTVQETVKSGADIITFSGDKLLGGPQAGIIVGKSKYIRMIKNNPLTRALRIDKMTLAALEATLKTYVLKPDKIESIPVIRMLTYDEGFLKKRAQKVVRAVKKQLPLLDISAVRDTSRVGGGAYPLHDLPTWAVSIDPVPVSVNACEKFLRTGSPPVISRISKDRVLLDMRTIFPDDDLLVAACIIKALTGRQNQ